MHRSFPVGARALVAVLAIAAGCSDFSRHPTDAVRAERPIQRGARRIMGPHLVGTVERVVPLANDVTWTFTVGPAGGTSSNSAVGLTITVPAGALTSTHTITVTALAGAPVAYHFAPHLEFEDQVHLKQKLSHLRLLSWIGVVGGHFPGDTLEVTGGQAAVTESMPAFISIFDLTVRIDVGHFSGWIVGSGNEDGPPDSSGGQGS